MKKIIQIIHRDCIENPGQFDHIYLTEDGEVWNYQSHYFKGEEQHFWKKLPPIPDTPSNPQ